MFLIIIVIIYNIYNNRKLDVYRKVEHYFNGLSYKEVYNRGSELLKEATLLLLDKNLEYERNNSGKINYYSLDNNKEYKKLTNFWLVSNTFSEKEINKVMDYKKIINKENKYYIEKYQSKDSKYIGSIIDIDSYDDLYVYFNSINYYCDNYDYIGVILEYPACNYQKTETKFSIVLENNRLKINNLEEIINIIK